MKPFYLFLFFMFFISGSYAQELAPFSFKIKKEVTYDFDDGSAWENPLIRDFHQDGETYTIEYKEGHLVRKSVKDGALIYNREIVSVSRYVAEDDINSNVYILVTKDQERIILRISNKNGKKGYVLKFPLQGKDHDIFVFIVSEG